MDLRLDLEGAAEVIGRPSVERIGRKLANRLDKHGNLRVVSSKYRLQGQNLEAALDRMEALIQEAWCGPGSASPPGPPDRVASSGLPPRNKGGGSSGTAALRLRTNPDFSPRVGRIGSQNRSTYSYKRRQRDF